MDDFKSIIINPGVHGVEIQNPTDYHLIGKGVQGAVFQLDELRCVKIYLKPTDAEREAFALQMAKDSPFFPKIFEAGENYVIMQYIPGITMKQYLKETGMLEKSITLQILNLLKEMDRLMFKRIDPKLRHILISEEGQLKVIDHVHAMKEKKKYPFYLFGGLKKQGLLQSFLKQIQTIDPVTYSKWKKSVEGDFYRAFR